MVKNQSEYLMKRYYTRKTICLEKLGNKCAKCKSTENLQFDHKNPESKVFEICDKLLSNFDSVLKELEKCQLLCFNCHVEKSTKEKTNYLHGTVQTYRREGCRCNSCKKAMSERRKTWKSCNKQ